MAFPQDVLGTKVEIWYDSAWHEITEDVRGTGTEDGEIEIDPRGQPNESTNLTVTQATLSVNNRDGKYSPRNLVSPLYGKIGMNTPLRIITDIADTTNVVDDFSTNGTNGWPNADSGHVWTSTGGAASDFLTTGGEAYHRHTATLVMHTSAVTTVDATDFDCVLKGIRMEAAPTPGGNGVNVYVRGRVSNAGNDYVEAKFRFSSGFVSVGLQYSVSGVTTDVGSGALAGSVLDSDYVNMRFRSVGRDLYVRGWETGTDEPTTWDAVGTVPLITPGSIEIKSRLDFGVTNTLPFDVTFQDVEFSLGIVLFTGEISEYPKKWDKTGNDVWVPLVASGLTRRITQGEKALRSPLYRHYVRRELRGYWSFENMEGSQTDNPTIMSDLTDGAPLVTTYPVITDVAAIKWSDENTLLGSDPLGSVSTGQNVDGYTAYGAANLLPTDATHDSFSVSFWNRVNLRGDIDNTQLQSTAVVNMQNASTVKHFKFTARQTTSGGTDTLELFALGYNADLTSLLVNGGATVTYEPRWRHFLFNVRLNGANLEVRTWVDGVLVDTSTVAATAVGQPVRLETYQFDLIDAKDLSLGFGHLAIASAVGTDSLLDAVTETVAIGSTAYAGETDAARIFRLCAEEGITYDSVESASDPLETRLGPQRSLTFMQLIHQAATAGGGVLYEMREDLGYRYKSRWALYGGASALTLDYSNTDLSEVPDTTDDDQRLRNKITVTRDGGAGTATAEQVDGPQSTNSPRAAIPGAGVYDDTPPAISLYSDTQLADFAGWRLRLGTWDESRFPGAAVALHRAPFTGDRTKLVSAALLDVAEIMTITNPPVWLPPDNIVLQVRSVKIFLSNFNWGIEWSCLPGRPWTDVATTTPTYGRADTVDSAIVSAVDSDDTDLVVFTEETNLPWSDPLWTEDIGELNILGAQGIDFRLNPQTLKRGLGGERVRAAVNTLISDTFTRSGQLSGSNADTGQTWVNTTGTAANATTDGSKAVLVHTAANTELRQSLPGTVADMCVQADVSFSIASATGASFFASLVFRQTDANNYYQVLFELSTASATTATIYVIKTVASVATNLSVKTIAHTSSSTVHRTKVVINNRDIFVKIWNPATETEGAWDTEIIGGAADILTGNDIALRSIRATGNTNTNPAAHFDNLTVTAGRIKPVFYDRFARTVANGIGTADVGGSWTTTGSGGSVLASDYNVAPNAASTLLAAAGNARGADLQSVSLMDVCVSLLWTCPVTTGGAIIAGFIGVRNTGSSTVYGYVDVNTDNSLTMNIGNTVSGNLAAATVHGAVHAGTSTPWRSKVAAYGDQILMKVWAITQNEPIHWQLRVTNPLAAANGYVGWQNVRSGGNTNVNPSVTIADFRVENPQKIVVQRGMDGVSRAWDAGTDMRLWTPAQVGR